MMGAKIYRDLLVWQKAVALVADLYEATKAFPESERYGLTGQIRRCAVSIPANIAEGYGRTSSMDLARFLDIAMGSKFELETLLLIAMRIGILPKREYDLIQAQVDEIEAMLASFIRSVRTRRKS